jgi:hypothetical protein
LNHRFGSNPAPWKMTASANARKARMATGPPVAGRAGTMEEV